MSPKGLQSIGFIFTPIIMFITHASSRYSFPGNLISEDEQYWHTVGFMIEASWFLVRIRQKESFPDNSQHQTLTTMLVANISGVESLAKQDENLTLKFESAQIITPGYLNGTGAWKIDPLKAVWTAEDPSNPGIKMDICETTSGDKYAVSIGSSPIEKLFNQKLRYQFPTAKPKA